jgi:glycerate kinase
VRVLVAFDKFKDALSAEAACAAAARVLGTTHPDWTLDLCPLTDGGEGFCETLCRNLGGQIEHVVVTGPRGEPVTAPVGFVPSHALPAGARRQLGAGAPAQIAVIGLAAASGLELLGPDRRDPWQTTTRGTGELLVRAVREKADAILLGIGGSATNDLGFGALATLGCKFYDGGGQVIAAPVPVTWEKIQRLDCSGAMVLPPLFIACDVTNPLLGPHGATATFGPQKGLRAADLPRLETQAARLAALLCSACGRPLALADTPGAGAAGGISFGLMVAAGAKLLPGFDLVSTWLDLPERVAAADLVITGEGRFDATSLEGKGPGSLVRAVRQSGKPVHVFAGSLGVAADQFLHAITPHGLPLAAALPRTAEFLAEAVARAL